MLLHEYSPQWRSDFLDIRKTLLPALAGIKVDIEHVGSTAVPGLAAKPIIDIDIVYFPAEDFSPIRERLSGIGYFHNGDQGIPGRETFKRSETAERHPVLDLIAHHLYACRSGAAELKRHLLFRDFLRQNDRAKKEYQSLKLRLAREAGQERAAYALLKEEKAGEFISSVIALAKAEEQRKSAG